MSCSEITQHARSFSPELCWAIEAADAAGKIIQEGVGQIHQIDQKGIGDLVSDVDRRADQAVTDTLRKYSDVPIMSEELSPTADDCSDLWVVDPLDGTSAYLMQAGNHYPAVLIARHKHGRTEVGVAYFPLTGEWFYAQHGCCAWKNAQRLKADDTLSPNLGESWVEMNQYGDSSLETEDFARLRDGLRSNGGASLVTTTVPNSGVALRIAESRTGLVAAIHDNRVDSVKQAPWDIAAPKLILEEAGGVFLNLDGNPIDPFHAEVMVVARSAKIANEIIEISKTASLN